MHSSRVSEGLEGSWSHLIPLDSDLSHCRRSSGQKLTIGDGVGEESLFFLVTVVIDLSAFIQIAVFAFCKAR